MSNSYFVDETIFSAGGVLVDKDKKVVYLVYKSSIDEWLLPKGRIEENETIESTAQREIFEETGHENLMSKLLSVQIRPDVANPSKSKIIFWFLSFLTNSNQKTNTQTASENFSGKWFSKDEAIKSLKWEDDKKLIEIVFKVLEQ